MFFRESPFHLWGISHGLPILFFIVLGSCLIIYARRNADRSTQKVILLGLSFIPFISFCVFFLMQIVSGVFSIQNDLPIHICRVLALTAPIVYWKENKFWTGVFYFWILAGTSNAVIAADIRYDFPHWTYIVYFAMHCGLVLLPIYYCLVMKHKMVLRDLWNAYWTAFLFMIATFVVNFTIGSNYMYTSHKPLVASILDHLGPWPWYIVAILFIGLGLFFILYLPFLIGKRRS